VEERKVRESKEDEAKDGGSGATTVNYCSTITNNLSTHCFASSPLVLVR